MKTKTEKRIQMTTLRKWRLQILIGGGLMAAGALISPANAQDDPGQTHGGIGKRDVYRDAQVNSADVDTPGSAPVATQAILQSTEFKSLAKNHDQELLGTDAFNSHLDGNAGQMLFGIHISQQVQQSLFGIHISQQVEQSLFGTHISNQAIAGTIAHGE
jgi:hypothetical protein